MKEQKIELTTSQKEAIEKMCEFIESGDPNSWFMLEGKAGVGKTTVLIDFMFKYNTHQRIVASAISHKAKGVLYTKSKSRLDKSKSKNTISFHSVAGLLGMRFDEISGEFTYDKNGYVIRPIDSADIIIVDEASMIDEKTMKLIFSNKKHNAKVIFSGDQGQLPPIRETDSDEVSPTFTTQYKYDLYERLRQGNDSPILPFSDYYWNSVMENINYTFQIPRHNIYGEHGNLIFSNHQEVLDATMNVFKRSIDEKDNNIIKAVCYRNDTRKQINNYIRMGLFESPKEFELNEPIMFYDNHELDEFNIIENSTECQILDIKDNKVILEGEVLKSYKLEIDYKVSNKTNAVIQVIANESKNDYERILTYLFDKAKKLEHNTREKSAAFKKAYSVMHRFANIDYSYAISSHKAQGSTYRAVIVFENDIMGVRAITDRTKMRSMYTAITRASNTCIIVR